MFFLILPEIKQNSTDLPLPQICQLIIFKGLVNTNFDSASIHIHPVGAVVRLIVSLLPEDGSKAFGNQSYVNPFYMQLRIWFGV